MSRVATHRALAVVTASTRWSTRYVRSKARPRSRGACSISAVALGWSGLKLEARAWAPGPLGPSGGQFADTSRPIAEGCARAGRSGARCARAELVVTAATREERTAPFCVTTVMGDVLAGDPD
jgi:hypothetical protein